MMLILMRMGMLMFQRFMLMVVPMRLQQVQNHSGQHQNAASDQHPSARAIA